MTRRPRLLILSFSPIVGDARVLKQVRHFATLYELTTCGYGVAPEGVANHIRIPDEVPANDLYGRFVTLRLYTRAYWRISAVAWCREHLVGGAWDVILANDVETVPLALSLEPRAGVHADLHEYSPTLHSNHAGWKKRIQPYYEWLCRTHVSRAQSWTTVSEGLARQYEKDFGFAPSVVINAAPYADLAATAPSTPIRLVHSGACLRKRNLVALVDAVAQATNPVTLDFFLTPNDPPYLAELNDRARDVPGVTVHPPVPYDALVETISGFDVGVFVQPPTTFSLEWSLPNKLFDYVQARLGILIGPSKEATRFVEEYSLGIVAENFSAEATARAIERLTPELVAEYKSNAASAAHALSAEQQSGAWDRAIRNLVGAVE